MTWVRASHTFSASITSKPGAKRDRPHWYEGALAVALLGALVEGARRDQGAFEAESGRLRQASAYILDRA